MLREPCECALHQEELIPSWELALLFSCGFSFALGSDLKIRKRGADPAVGAFRLARVVHANKTHVDMRLIFLYLDIIFLYPAVTQRFAY